MATHSSMLAWEIPWTEELCGLQSMGSQSFRHDLNDGAHTQTHTKSVAGGADLLSHTVGKQASQSLLSFPPSLSFLFLFLSSSLSFSLPSSFLYLCS